MTTAPVKPDIKSYLNVYDFLKDIYQFRKNTEESFSYEIWARELGLTNRSFLRQMIVGRRSLTEDTAQTLCRNMNFSATDQEYFQLLVLYSNARSAEKRSFFWKKLKSLIQAQIPMTEIPEVTEFVRNPLYPRLQALLGYKDLSRDVSSLAMLLKRPEDDIEKALRTLENHGLAEESEQDNSWQTKTGSFKVSENIGHQALLDFHEQSLKEAIAARSADPSERRYRSLLLALSETEFADFLKDLDVFVKQTFGKYDGEALSQRKLFQINFNLHAVTICPPAEQVHSEEPSGC